MPIDLGMRSVETACERNRMKAFLGRGTWLSENLRPCFFFLDVASVICSGGADGIGWHA